MHFKSIYFLLLLFLLPWIYKFKQKQLPPSIPHPDIIAKLKDYNPTSKLKARLPLLLRLSSLALLIFALARPQMGYVADMSNRNGVDIMVALDVSSSMTAEDFRPNRISVAKEVLANFIKSRSQDRIGLIVFGSKSYVQCPLTIDHNTLLSFLSEVNIGLAEDGTAIGMALANAVNRLKDSKAKSKIILLLTDGENNSGPIDPLTAAKLAATYNLKIYAIGIGDPKGAPIPIMDNFGQKTYARLPDGSLQLTKMNFESLKNIAGLTNGDAFIAGTAGALGKVFDQIDKMEKSKFQAKDRFISDEYFGRLALPALILLIAEFLISRFYLRTLP